VFVFVAVKTTNVGSKPVETVMSPTDEGASMNPESIETTSAVVLNVGAASPTLVSVGDTVVARGRIDVLAVLSMSRAENAVVRD